MDSVLDVITSEGFLQNVQKIGQELENGLNRMKEEFPNIIEEIRGVGMMLGIKINSKFDNNEIVKIFIKNQLLTIPAGENVIRILPPLIIDSNHVKEALEKIKLSFLSFLS